MSAGSAARTATRPARVVASRPSPFVPHLKVVRPRRSQAAKAPFVVLVVVLLASGLLGLLALNTVLAQDAFALHNLEKQRTELEAREQVLQREVDAREAPAALAARASALGMVANTFPVFLDPRTGRVLGNVQGEQGVIPLTPAGPPVTAAPKPKPAAVPRTTAARPGTNAGRPGTTAARPGAAASQPRPTTAGGDR